MVVGFVNSGIMTLKQAIHVIMGANVGTTVTAWILSLAGIEGSNLFLKLLKPSSFTPVLALVGIIYYLFIKNERKKDIGLILLGFATLIYGMEGMSAAVRPLGEMEEFRNTVNFFKSSTWGAAWCHCDRYYPKFVRFGGNPSGLVRYGTGHDGNSYTYNNGAEYRYLCYSVNFIGGNK